jgi:hypothetical protein
VVDKRGNHESEVTPMQDFAAHAAGHAAHDAQADTRRREAEIAAARARDTRRREQGTLAPETLLARSVGAARWAIPGLSADEAQDVAAEVRLRVARRHGWTPPAEHPAVTRRGLGLEAVTVWRDARRRVADTVDAESMDAPVASGEDGASPETRHDFLACALGDHLPANAADTPSVAAALGVDPDSPAGDAVAAALAGWHVSADLAAARGITEQSARVRLTRGRAVIRRRMTADTLVIRLLEADAGELPLAVAPGDRVRLSPRARAARAAVDAAGMGTAILPACARPCPPLRDDPRDMPAPSTIRSRPASVLAYIAAVERAANTLAARHK